MNKKIESTVKAMCIEKKMEKIILLKTVSCSFFSGFLFKESCTINAIWVKIDDELMLRIKHITVIIIVSPDL